MRQDIQKRLWPDDTVVEFENSINAAVKRLRVALGDSADQPRYIETLARRGYHWKAPVAWIDHPGVAMEPPPVPTPVPPPASSPDAPTDERISRDRSEIKGGRRRPALVAGGGLVVAAAMSVGAYLMMHRPPKLTPKDSIVVADFSNATGDPVFDGTLRQGLTSQVEQSPYLNVLSDEQIVETLRLMGQPRGTRLTHDLARQVCQRTGGVAVLDGFVTQIGSQYNLVLNALNCSTGALFGSAQATAGDKNHVLSALAKVSSSIRDQLGESLASIQKFNTPLEEVTTPSLEALQAYTLGWQANLNGDESAAVASFQRAISLDPNFAMAYAALGTAYGGIGESRLAVENTTKAYDLRDRVSEREKFYITSHYEDETGHEEKAAQIYELWAQTYPRDVVPVGRLGFYYSGLGQYEKSMAAGRRALELAPDRGLPYELLVSSYLCLDRLDEAVAVLQQAKARGIDSQPLHETGYAISFLRGDTEGMAREQGWAAGRPGIEDLFLDLGSDSAAYVGQLVQANAMTARAVAMARQAGKKGTATTYLAEASLREALVGNVAEARKRASAALEASNGQDFEVALALALAGDLARAQKFADDLARQFPQDAVNGPTIRAVISLGQHSPAKAISDLEAASPYELVEAGELTLYPVYVRGQAYLAGGQGAAAAAEFQKILDHRGLALNEVIFPLAYLGVGRARVISGDKPGARKAYQDFFACWQHADPDLPILQQAKAEFARLQ